MLGETVLSACYSLNRVPYKKLDQSPYELLNDYALNLSFLRLWVCLDKLPLYELKRENISPKIFDYEFIVYA